MKTWEKIYWGLDITLMMLSLVGYKAKPEKYTIEINEVKRIMTWGGSDFKFFYCLCCSSRFNLINC